MDEDPDPSGRDDQERYETALEKLDRNWTDLLQELRVLQAGVQLLTGLLLTVPFRQRFVELPGDGLAALGLAVTGVVTLIFDTVLGSASGAVAGACTIVGLLGLWWVTPIVLLRAPARSSE